MTDNLQGPTAQDRVACRVTAPSIFRCLDAHLNTLPEGPTLFLTGTPQSIVDWVAQVSDDCAGGRGPNRDNVMALLDRTEQCCGRALCDHVNMLLGVGPDCARQMLLPHSLEVANRILQQRQQLLGAAQ